MAAIDSGGHLKADSHLQGESSVLECPKALRLDTRNRWECEFTARIEYDFLARTTNNRDFPNYRAPQHGVYERIDPKFTKIAANRELTGFANYRDANYWDSTVPERFKAL